MSESSLSDRYNYIYNHQKGYIQKWTEAPRFLAVNKLHRHVNHIHHENFKILTYLLLEISK